MHNRHRLLLLYNQSQPAPNEQMRLQKQALHRSYLYSVIRPRIQTKVRFPELLMF